MNRAVFLESDYSSGAVYENGVRMIISSPTREGVTLEGSEGSVW